MSSGETLIEEIQRRRKALEWTQGELAARMALSEQWLSKQLGGKVKIGARTAIAYREVLAKGEAEKAAIEAAKTT